MLDDLFAVPAAGRRLRSCLFGSHLDAFASSLHALGYPRPTIRNKLWSVARLARWMTRKHLGIGDLDEARIEVFLIDERRGRRARHRGVRVTLLRLLAELREAGTVPTPPPTHDASPQAALLARYEDHLRRERAVAPSTIAGYRRVIGEFVAERLAGASMSTGLLLADAIRAFLLQRVRRVSPKYAQLIAAALRSFTRFLFVRGETITDLTCAIPVVRQERLVSVPRHLPTADVERLLASCDRSTATGRRDYALLLLLARLGLRAGEIRALQLDDVRWRAGEIRVRGKGQVHDVLPLPQDVGEAIAHYIKADRPAGPSRQVFICRKAPHRGFSHPSSVSTIVTRALARAGLTPAMRGAHLLRHSLATTMVAHGASLSEIGQVLRHRSPATTEIYAKVDLGALRDVAQPWPGAAGVR